MPGLVSLSLTKRDFSLLPRHGDIACPRCVQNVDSGMTSKLFPSIWNLDHQVDQVSALEIRHFSTTCVEFITPTAQPCI